MLTKVAWWPSEPNLRSIRAYYYRLQGSASHFSILYVACFWAPAFQKCSQLYTLACVSTISVSRSQASICQSHQSQCSVTLHWLWWVWRCVHLHRPTHNVVLSCKIANCLIRDIYLNCVKIRRRLGLRSRPQGRSQRFPDPLALLRWGKGKEGRGNVRGGKGGGEGKDRREAWKGEERKGGGRDDERALPL